MSELDRLAVIGRAVRLAALVLAMVIVVGSASWLGMRAHPARTTATSAASGIGQSNGPVLSVAVRPGGGVAPGRPPDLYVVPGVGDFVYLTDGECYCWPVAYPSDTIFVPPPGGKVTPCRCMDMRGAAPVYPIVHVLPPIAP